MKNTRIALTFLFLFIGLMMPVHAQEGATLSLDTKPEPLEATPFTFPPYEEFTLDNGLHVFVVENHEVPTITFSLAIRAGEAQDPTGKAGVASMMSDMLGKGTSKRSARETAEALDGVGASISARTVGQSTTISGSALKKHSDLLFSILGEQLTTAVFDENEFAKMRDQYLASVASQKGDALELAQTLARKVLYGFDHPIATHQTEQSIKAIERGDLVAFYNTYIIPNISSIAVVGDVTVDEVRALLNKHLKSWKKKTAPDVSLPERQVAEAGVYFIPREGSVQSSVVVGAAVPGTKDPDHLALDVTASYFGSSFGSILFETLRETYSYTYSPFGYVTRGGQFNRLSTGAEVRASVTDSAITVILAELNRIGSEGPDPDKLDRRIALLAGQYRLAFERASTVAGILQNAWLSDMPLEMAIGYDKRLEAIGYSDVQKASRKYFGPFDLRLVVVGPPDVREKLEQFGPIFEYTLDVERASAAAYEEVDMSVQELVDAHREGLGGADALAAISTVTMTGTASMKMQGRSMDGSITRKLMVPNKEYVDVDLGMMKQVQWFDGSNGWVSLNGGAAGPMSPEEAAKIAVDSRVFPGLALTDNGYDVTILGKKDGAIHVKVSTPAGSKQTMVFNAETMLLQRFEKIEETPQGPVTNIEKYDAYTVVGGVQFPTTVMTQNPIYSLEYTWTVTVNDGVSNADFAPAER